MVDGERTHPVTGGGVQPGRNLGVSLEETLRANIKRHAVEDFFERTLLDRQSAVRLSDADGPGVYRLLQLQRADHGEGYSDAARLPGSAYPTV